MKISKAYKKYSNYFNHSDPELLLGSNWKDVLNFWLFLDTLTEEQWRILSDRYKELDYSTREAAQPAAKKAARDAAQDAVSAGVAAQAARDVAWIAARWATYEIIGSHILLNQNKPLTFLPMFLNL